MIYHPCNIGRNEKDPDVFSLANLANKRASDPKPYQPPAHPGYWDHPLMSPVQDAAEVRSERATVCRVMKSETGDVPHGVAWHRNWSENPFIMATDSRTQVWTQANNSKDGMGMMMIRVLNPNVSQARQRTILDMQAQARHYFGETIHPLYVTLLGDWYCHLDEILEEEIVGCWYWEHIAHNKQWYEEIVMPAFQKHDAEFQAARKLESNARDSDSIDREKHDAQIEAAKKASVYSSIGSFLKGFFVRRSKCSRKAEAMSEKTDL